MEWGPFVLRHTFRRKRNETTADLACALQYVGYLFPNDEEAMLRDNGGIWSQEECAVFANECGAKAVAVVGASEWV